MVYAAMGMYGHGAGGGSDGESMKSRRRSSIGMDSLDIAKILGVYFRDNENLAVDEEKLQLTAELIRIFSTPPGRDLASQVSHSGTIGLLI